ncbi:hypothetical protein Pmar_PMAR028633 [Perkinsus marinus ATCC 50983]|uniref:Uncharacterized protein n=1 Tax=Perkinsus marinus (strain ATCC 50983 / TXsc) TaxID=423536 RepID=C5K8G1_PERM5|nr:hypothetical protein Pmar_PMAR028633 [Perkinsus marinus ATCC 50983]EER19168.1 hypothetical protein Pmar_PMAR028633 [Perkinsus marinus ATCC 50983]|eukprot:XP_002787372.1 hypothetical protein Pmar_PMAR028633 [Perkinsus marinus ATCC 50983]
MSISSSSIHGESAEGADHMAPRAPGFLPPPDALDELDAATTELFGLLAAPADPPGDDPTAPSAIVKDETDKALKLERFSGSPSSIRLVEWRRRFKGLAAVRAWPWDTVLVKLKAFLTGPATRLIDVYQPPDDPRDAADAIRRAFDKAYGFTASQTLYPAWNFLETKARDAVAATIFWSALPRTSQSLANTEDLRTKPSMSTASSQLVSLSEV